MVRESLNQPLMVIFEDLHWIDSETQALLNLLVEAIANARILLLVNYRPEYRHEWGSRSHYTQLRLDPLGRESAEEMLSAVLGDGEDLIPLKRVIVERTQGNPFFMEEMVQTLFEEGMLERNETVKLAQPISAIKVPPSVQTVLASRIDRLSAPEKELLQTLAVLGREFSLSLAQHVTLKSVDDLEQMLSRLRFGDFIYEQPAVGEVEYSFKHALTQEVAYKSLLNERRRELHERAGRSLEEIYPQQLNEHYGDLAHHYLLSDNAAKGINYAQLAAEQALTRGTYADAISLTDAALKLLDRLPDESDRLRAELALRNIKSVLAFVLRGNPSLEHERAIRRVCELAEKIGEKEQLLRGLTSLSSVYFTRGESRQGFELARRCLDLAKATQDDSVLADACYLAGILACGCGALRESVSRLNEAAVHIARTERRTISGLGLPVGGFSSIRAFPLPWLGRVGEALTLSEEGLRFARNSGELFFLSLALAFRAQIFLFRREPELAQALSAEAIVLSEENGFPDWLDLGHFIHGSAWIELGQLHRGIAELEEAIAYCRRVGGQPRQQYFISLIAYAYARMGQSEKGFSMLNEALIEIERTGKKVDHAETLRLMGEVLLMRDPSAMTEAEKCFREALEVARAQEAKWWELRTTVRLARLLRDTGRRDEARTTLADIYNWFTEGFDTVDLKEAKALLYELSS
jgi:tetratricopeptide (TPR) repeat protein